MKKLALLFCVLVASVALAQAYVQPMPCARPSQQWMNFPMLDAGAQFVPTTGAGAHAPLSMRRNITVCNSTQNLGAPVFKCRWDCVDAGWPVSTLGVAQGPGLSLAVGDCVTIAEPMGCGVKCITSHADAGLEVTECR